LRSQLCKEVNKIEAKIGKLVQVNYKNMSLPYTSCKAVIKSSIVFFQNKRRRTILINVSLRGMESSDIYIIVGASLRYWLWKISSLLDKAVPLQAWTGLVGSRLRLPDFMTMGT